MSTPPKIRFASSLIGALCMFAAIRAANAEPVAVANITAIEGVISVQHADGECALLDLQAPLYEKDILTSEADSRARIEFADQSVVLLPPESSLSIEAYAYPPENPATGNILLRLIKGGLRKITGLIGHAAPPQDQMQTPVASIGIRGTHYGLIYCQDNCQETVVAAPGQNIANGLHVDVTEGEISVNTRQNQLTVTAGQFAYVQTAEHEAALIPPEQGLQMNIPAIMIDGAPSGDIHNPHQIHGQCTDK